MNHHNLQKIEPKDVTVEMEKSRRILGEFMGEIPDTLAYPYGSGEDNVSIRQKAKDAGYRIAVGVHSGKWTLEKFQQSPFNLPRVFVRGDENMLDFRLQLSRGQSRL
jgi:peptidoglycan/xylan/chitin deacetylase (PgdA/CDA1 family)